MSKPANLTTQEYIDFLQRFIIVHSHIYYNLNRNVISDRVYDSRAKELTMYKEDYPELWKSSMYHKQFGDDYNGCTGFDLYDGLDDDEKKKIHRIASSVLRCC
nr:hypothetical protein [uncultured Mediterraneibacter sp.]